jgi:hypothetical protein
MKENGHPYKLSVRLWYVLYWLIALMTKKTGKAQTKIARAGEIASWSRFLIKYFGDEDIRLFSDKDKLRRDLFALIKANETVVVFELGVAYGLGSKWTIGILGAKLVEFHGFDRFTGLPRPWRGMPVGHFSTKGKVPNIDDSRVTWHIGDVENTLETYISHKADWLKDPERETKLVVLFDLDILEPTARSYELLQPWLKGGDLIHFDEAFDAENERLILEIFLGEFEVKFIGYTSEAASFEIVSRKNS